MVPPSQQVISWYQEISSSPHTHIHTQTHTQTHTHTHTCKSSYSCKWLCACVARWQRALHEACAQTHEMMWDRTMEEAIPSFSSQMDVSKISRHITVRACRQENISVRACRQRKDMSDQWYVRTLLYCYLHIHECMHDFCDVCTSEYPFLTLCCKIIFQFTWISCVRRFSPWTSFWLAAKLERLAFVPVMFW